MSKGGSGTNNHKRGDVMAKKKATTPGPWQYGGPVTRDHKNVQAYPQLKAKFWEVGREGDISPPGVAAVNSEADAILVAAAPELLDALEKAAAFVLASRVPGFADLHMHLKTVILKAKGQ